MKYFIVIIFPLLILSETRAESLASVKEEQLTALKGYSNERVKRYNDIDMLKEAKFYLINGNFSRAENLIRKIKPIAHSTKLIAKRYQGIIYFLTNRWEEAGMILLADEFNQSPQFKNLCSMQIILKIALDRKKNLNQLRSRCFNHIGKESRMRLLWYDSIVEMANLSPNAVSGKSLNNVRRYAANDESAAQWLKLILYLNQEKVLLKRLKDLPLNNFRSKRIREIIGLILYRTGNISQSLEFVKDIDLPNSNNIKGNISLQKKEYEQAYGHFQLALKKKNNSLNSLYRTIPLSWILKDTKKGLDFIKKVSLLEKEKTYNDEQKIIHSVFLTKNNNHKQSLNNLRILNSYYKEKPPLPLAQVNIINNLTLGNSLATIENSTAACLKFDALNCYLLSSLYLWEDLPKTLERDDKVSASSIDLEAIKSMDKELKKPFNEEVVFHQKDLEELDEKDQGKFDF